MKLKEYFEDFKKLIEKHPEYMEMEVIYSSDDEGNRFGKVIYSPSIMQIEDLNEYHLEESAETDKPNAICIN